MRQVSPGSELYHALSHLPTPLDCHPQIYSLQGLKGALEGNQSHTSSLRNRNTFYEVFFNLLQLSIPFKLSSVFKTTYMLFALLYMNTRMCKNMKEWNWNYDK